MATCDGTDMHDTYPRGTLKGREIVVRHRAGQTFGGHDLGGLEGVVIGPVDPSTLVDWKIRLKDGRRVNMSFSMMRSKVAKPWSMPHANSGPERILFVTSPYNE